MRVGAVISFSIAAGIIVFLISSTLGSPVGISDVPTTGLPLEILNDEGVSTQRNYDDIVEVTGKPIGRQAPGEEEEEGDDEDEEEVATTTRIVNATTTTIAPPPYNESDFTSEFKYTESNFGPNGTVPFSVVPGEKIPEPPVEPVVGSAGIAEVAPLEASVAPVPAVNSTAAIEPAVVQPAAVDAPISNSSATDSPVAVNSFATGNSSVVEPAASNSSTAAVPASTTDEDEDEDTEEATSAPVQAGTDTDNTDTEDADIDNEITQDEGSLPNADLAVGTTGRPIDVPSIGNETFESEYNYTIQYLQDGSLARQEASGDESEESKTGRSTFVSEYHITSQFLHDGEGRADCECGKIPFNVPASNNAAINEYPWTVALVRGGLFGGGRPHCAGTLINDRYVMTASHCMEGLYPSDIQVWMTVHNSFDTTSTFGVEKKNVQEIIMHPNYNRNTNENDIALLKLSQPMSISSKNYFVPACLPAGNIDYAGNTAKITAWSDGTRNQICKADMPVLSNNVCNRDTKHRDKITENMICAGFLTPIKQQDCVGDAGGPLVVPNSGRHTLIGVVSWGYRDAGNYSPTVYTRVSGYADWILHNSRDADWCGN